ncbi:MAG: hypothetical protein EPN56_11135 [Rhodanobacter sp.]|nr:MAG: hypothetical protein EPN78_12680 [Rhodanobacter sp.]TAM13145.1 MAG: hypothetical protein EPN66_06325 [Rhodanobacter sp.]TAM35146.1 MAG: hypothetical protein EPN56_11135 [Rhodanobacter sp.]
MDPASRGFAAGRRSSHAQHDTPYRSVRRRPGPGRTDAGPCPGPGRPWTAGRPDPRDDRANGRPDRWPDRRFRTRHGQRRSARQPARHQSCGGGASG